MKTALTALCFLALTIKASTQTINMPQYEFSFNVAGGISTLNYKIDNATLKRGFAGNAGFGFHYFFNDNFAITTGLEAALYRATINASTIESAKYIVVEGYQWDEEYIYHYNITGFEEKQNLLALQLPIMAKFLMPLGESNHNLFLALGGRLGYSLWGNYEQSAQSFEQRIFDFFGIISPDRVSPSLHEGFNQKASLKFANFNAMASAEAGVRWKLNDKFSLYTGVFVDYGLLNIIPKRTEEALIMFAGMSGNFQNFAHNSILSAHAPDYATNTGGQQVTFHRNENSYPHNNKVNNLATGIKIKIAFGKPKARPIPEVEPEIIPEPEEEPEVEPEVEPEPTEVLDTITEIPEEIRQSMINISNTLFEFDRWNLSSEAIVELAKVMKWLNEHPTIHVEIEGHTDNIGSQAYNQRLSEDRARSVYEYFVAHGVKSQRLSFRGYGFSKPVADNSTAEGRQKNRRVELKIIIDE